VRTDGGVSFSTPATTCEVVGGPEIEREERPPGNLPGAFDLADLATSWT